MMKTLNKYNIFKFLIFFLFLITVFLTVFLNKNLYFYTAGYILNYQCNLFLIAFKMMLIIVIPVIFLIFFVSYNYRQSNILSVYTPNWAHSFFLESVCWLTPIVIIFFLAILSWNTTHQLEPSQLLAVNVNKPITIDVVSLNWRWLFIYPYYKIATINEISFPKNVPVRFRITSHSIMNSFFIPDLGSQIYTMAGMKTELNLLAIHQGIYKGISSNYSGRGFSNMKFTVHVKNNISDFHKWIQQVKVKKNVLLFKKQFVHLSLDNEQSHIQYFSYVDPLLFYKIMHSFHTLHSV